MIIIYFQVIRTDMIKTTKSEKLGFFVSGKGVVVLES